MAGRKLSKHGKITALCTLLLFAGAFALIASNQYKPYDAASATIQQPRRLDAEALNVTGYLQASPSELTAFDNKVNAGGTVTIASRGDLLALAQRVNEGNDFAFPT